MTDDVSQKQLTTESLRVCSICDDVAYTEEDLERFRKNKNRPHGRDNFCKKCNLAAQHRWVVENEGRSWIRKTDGVERWFVIQNSRVRPRSHVVMEEVLGRPLNPNEVTHHINEDTLDDRKENLQVMTNSEHSRLHKLKNNPSYGQFGSDHPSWKGDQALSLTIKYRETTHRGYLRRKERLKNESSNSNVA